MPSDDSNPDGGIDTGDVLAPGERVVCPECGEASTNPRECSHCGYDLTDDVPDVTDSFAGP